MTIKERVQEVFNRFNVNLEVEDKVRVDLAEAALENGTVIYTDADSFVEGAEAYIINDEGERITLPPGDYTLADGGTLNVGDLGVVNRVDKPAGADNKAPGAQNDGKTGPVNIDPTKRVAKPKPQAPGADPVKQAPKQDAVPPKKKPAKKKLAEEQQEDMNVQLNEEQVLAMLVERFPDLGEELAAEIAAAVAEVYAAPVEEEVEEPVVEEAKEEEKEEMTETPEVVQEVVEEKASEEIEVEVEMSEEKPEKTEFESLKEALAETNARLEQLQKFAAHGGLKHKAPAQKVEKLDLSKMTIEERVRALANQLSK